MTMKNSSVHSLPYYPINSIVTNNKIRNYIDIVFVSIYKCSGLVTKIVVLVESFLNVYVSGGTVLI